MSEFAVASLPTVAHDNYEFLILLLLLEASTVLKLCIVYSLATLIHEVESTMACAMTSSLIKVFTSRKTSSTTRRRSIRLSPIVEYSRLQPPVGV